MCGITGFYSPKLHFSKEELIKMTNKLTHRGPDAQGYFYKDGFGLGHRRLSIIDLSEDANQPMTSSSGRYSIVFNGEIYNYNELRQEFRLNCKTSSDTEVILEMFERFGTECVEYFNGMFAFAILDNIEKNIHIFRDRIGIKPLFYFWDGVNLAFASELKSLLQISYVLNNISINYSSVNEFLHMGFIPTPNTIYKNIHKLQSGCYLKTNKEETTINSYWKLDDHIHDKDSIIADEIQAREILRDLVDQSVRYRLKSDVPFGTFLSGGIDSSLVTAVAQRNISGKLNTFSIGFKDAKHDESSYARSVADYLDTNHHELIVTEKDAQNLIETVLNQFDEPYADSSAIPTMIVSELARKHVTMTLSGDGGDELFHGYGAYEWAHRLSNKRLRTFRKPLSMGMRMFNNRFKRASYLIDFDDVRTIKSHVFSQEQYFSTRKQINRLLNEEYYSKIELDEVYNFHRLLTEREGQAIFDINYYLKDDLLVKVDRSSMIHSLETRVPLLDHNIVEFALNLSPNLKVKNGISKYLLKEVLYDYVPAHLFNRPKWGFSIPLQKWLQKDLLYLIHDNLNSNEIDKYGILSKQEVNSLIHLFTKKGHSYLYNRIWTLIVLQKFLSSHI